MILAHVGWGRSIRGAVGDRVRIISKGEQTLMLKREVSEALR